MAVKQQEEPQKLHGNNNEEESAHGINDVTRNNQSLGRGEDGGIGDDCQKLSRILDHTDG